MSIKRYTADKDTVITNAFKSDLRTRATGSNMGASDSLEVFSIYAQENTGSIEIARTLVQFPTNEISNDRTNSKIPEDGNVQFYLRLFNVPHAQTLPKGFTLLASPISRSWEEGTGLDMEQYLDDTNGGEGANWIFAGAGSAWTTPGGDLLTSSLSQSFPLGNEDLEINVTPIVENWIQRPSENYGFAVHLTTSQESGSNGRSYFTKRFSARRSEFFFSRPIIEARWDNSRKDNRGNAIFSSSLLTQADNLNTLYMYNFVRGKLQNIPSIGGGPLRVALFSGTLQNTGPSTSSILVPQGGGAEQDGVTFVSGGAVATGIYTASFAISKSSPIVSEIYDVWQDLNGNEFHTGSFIVKTHDARDYYETPEYVTKIINLKSSYRNKDKVRLRVFTRLKDWHPSIYSIASNDIENNLVEDAYYRVYRVADNLDVVKYGTGSLKETRLSYDHSGSYFDLDVSLLQPDFMYAIKFMYDINDDLVEQPEVFKFRVDA